MLCNQNNFSNKRNSFIPQINSDLATPATSDPDLKSSIHSTHNNSKTLELFNKSSVVDFTIDEILTELWSESEINNGSILLFPPIDKQEIFPIHPNAPFNSSSLIFATKRNRTKEGKKYAPRKIFRKVLKSLSRLTLISIPLREVSKFYK